MTGLDEHLQQTGAVLRLHDADPALFDLVPDGELREARARVTVRVNGLARGPWDWRSNAGTTASVGLLVLDGLLLRTVCACGRRGAELLGPGDVLRPWEDDGAAASIPYEVTWRVLERAEIAILDDRFAHGVRPWPEVLSAILGRAVQRSHWLALQLTISDLRRVEDRILAAFWHFADRWGTARRDGIALPLAITHEVLAQLISAQRPTVSAALHRLQDGGRLQRMPDRTWLLLGEPPQTLPALLSASA